jgi:formylglycine-generating enzyme required for sulfatase activity
LSAGATWGVRAGHGSTSGGDDTAGGGDNEIPEHTAGVGSYGLDRYDVTIGRMRRFVEAHDKAELLSLLDGGAGAHPGVSGPKWQSAWDDTLPADADALEIALACDVATWTDGPGGHETYPTDCVSWYVAYAFPASRSVRAAGWHSRERDRRRHSAKKNATARPGGRYAGHDDDVPAGWMLPSARSPRGSIP